MAMSPRKGSGDVPLEVEDLLTARKGFERGKKVVISSLEERAGDYS
jgi:hypothetical protein